MITLNILIINDKEYFHLQKNLYCFLSKNQIIAIVKLMQKYKQKTENDINQINQNLANILEECKQLRNDLKSSNETNFYMHLEIDKLYKKINCLELKVNEITYDQKDDLSELLKGQCFKSAPEDYVDLPEVSSLNTTGVDNLLNNIENVLCDNFGSA